MSEMATAFEHTRVPYGDDGRLVRGIIARCGAPNCEAAIPDPVNTQGNGRGVDYHIEHQFIARKLEMKGWRIGKSRTSHRCPRCFNAAKTAAIHKSEKKIMSNKKEMLNSTSSSALQVVQENPRVMTREDRRIIFAKLNEVYDGDCYSSGWTDEKVATDLGVPRAWVRVIREENIGDNDGNYEIRAQIKEAQTALAQARAIEPDMRRLLGLMDKVEKSLAEIQKILK